MSAGNSTKIRGAGLRQLRRRFGSQSGQVVVLTAIGMVAFCGLTAFVLDLGAAFHVHRKTQAAADASALAAAQMLPNTAVATTVFNGKAAQNLPEGTVTPTYSSTYVANDTVTATAQASSPTFFAKIFGLNSIKATTTATALIGSYQGWAGNIMPWTTDKSLVWGQDYTFKVDQGNQPSPGNFGNVSLPIQGQGCPLGQGSDYKLLIAGIEHACLVQKGDALSASGSTGNKTGQTAQGLNMRGVVQNFDPYSILAQQPDGSYVLTTYNHPNLVVIPVIDSFGNGGSSTYTVVGFAWFIITSYTSKTVTGMFISSEAPNGATCPTASDPNAGCPIGGYDPFGFKVVQLIK